MSGDAVSAVLLVVVALGFRHALEPDHVVAITALTAGGGERSRRAAARLGVAWGAGHGVTLIVFAVPAVVLAAHIPAEIERGAELLVGFLIALLAVRLLIRWSRGGFHVHEHEHDGVRHTHVHEHRDGGHAHPHEARTVVGAFALGLVHGLGGSAGATVLVASLAESKAEATISLLALAIGACLAMALFSVALAVALRIRGVRRRFRRVVPAVATLSLAFAAYYTLAALGG